MSQKAQSTYAWIPAYQDCLDMVMVLAGIVSMVWLLVAQNEPFSGLAQPLRSKKQVIPLPQLLQSTDVEFQFSKIDVYTYLKNIKENALYQ